MGVIHVNSFNENSSIKKLCSDLSEHSSINPKLYDKFFVKRGLRNSDGTGVVAGITNICNVHGYVVNEGDREPIDGELIYRGYSIKELVENVTNDDRFGFEEITYLLLTGKLPNKKSLAAFSDYLAERRELPSGFVVDMILKAPSKNIMNKLGRSVLALYSYDEECENHSIENEMRIALELVAKLPVIMTNAYQTKKSYYEHKSMIMHPIRKDERMAETILSLMRFDRKYTKEEAQLLDTMLMLHAEHGGGNNSTFTCRVLTSSGTDAYSAYSAAIGSLKGHRHGGANIKVMQMLDDFKENVRNWEDEERGCGSYDKDPQQGSQRQVRTYLRHGSRRLYPVGSKSCNTEKESLRACRGKRNRSGFQAA